MIIGGKVKTRLGTDLPPEWLPSDQARQAGSEPSGRRVASDRRRSASPPDKSRPPGDSRHRVRRLSEREHQVVRLVAQGLKDAVIARRLGIAVSTVGTHVRSIRYRLKLDSRAAIAAWVTARLNPDDPAGRLRRRDPARTSGCDPDVRAS